MSYNNILNVNFLDRTKVTGLLANPGDLLTLNDAGLLTVLPNGTTGQYLRVNTVADPNLEYSNIQASDINFPGAAAGDVLYINGSGDLAVDTGNFVYNDTEKSLEFDSWVVDANAAAPQQGLTLGTISGQATTGDSIALGDGSSVSGTLAIALGANASATGNNAIALGQGSVARCPDMINIAGPQNLRASETVANGTERLQKFANGTARLATEIIDSTATGTYAINLGGTCRFYPERVEFVQVVAGTGGPGNTGTFDFGDGTTVDAYFSVTNYKGNRATREVTIYSGPDSTLGTQSPTFTITAAGTSSGTFRVVWIGQVIEE